MSWVLSESFFVRGSTSSHGLVIFAIFVFMTWPTSIYVVLWSIFYFHLYFDYDHSYDLMNIDRFVFLLIFFFFASFACLFFRTCPIIFGWRMRIVFKYQKFSLRVLLSICLIFCQFQPGIAYKSVIYKKRACTSCLSFLSFPFKFKMNGK